MSKFLRTNIADQMRPSIRMPIHVTIKASDTTAWKLGAPVFCLIELLLWERRQKQPQAFELLWIQDPIEHFEMVGDCQELPMAHVAEVGPSGQKNGWRKFRHEMIREIEIEIEARQIPLFLPQDFINHEPGK